MSPIPFTAPLSTYEVGSSSMTVQIPSSTTVASKLVLVSTFEPPPLVADLVTGLGSGLPLDRPEEMRLLAEEILKRPTGFPANWASLMAEESSRYDD